MNSIHHLSQQYFWFDLLSPQMRKISSSTFWYWGVTLEAPDGLLARSWDLIGLREIGRETEREKKKRECMSFNSPSVSSYSHINVGLLFRCEVLSFFFFNVFPSRLFQRVQPSILRGHIQECGYQGLQSYSYSKSARGQTQGCKHARHVLCHWNHLLRPWSVFYCLFAWGATPIYAQGLSLALHSGVPEIKPRFVRQTSHTLYYLCSSEIYFFNIYIYLLSETSCQFIFPMQLNLHSGRPE